LISLDYVIYVNKAIIEEMISTIFSSTLEIVVPIRLKKVREKIKQT